MDAVKFIVTRDRMCRSFNGRCNECEVKKRMGAGDMCIYYMARHPQEVVEIVERWGKEHPRKTRQSEFLKMFPRTGLGDDGLVGFCPEDMDSEFACPRKNYDTEGNRCGLCRKKYWLEEVEDDDQSNDQNRRKWRT